MADKLNPNSKIIEIYRKPTLLSQAQPKDTEAYFANSNVSIGSYFEKGSQKIGSGLDFSEEALLLPFMIDIPSEDREFRKKVSEFYAEITTTVPYTTGTKLEIGLTQSNEKVLGKENMPINLMEYLRYRHAKNHPWVAASKEVGEGDQMKLFYIFDKQNMQAKNTEALNNKDAAMQVYLTIKKKPEVVDHMLTLMGTDPREFKGLKNEEALKIEKLNEYVNTKPAIFLKIYEGGDIEIKYRIETMVKVKVLKKIGDKYIDPQGKDGQDEIIANTLDELIWFMKDEVNSATVATLKARMQEGMNNPVDKEVKQTIV